MATHHYSTVFDVVSGRPVTGVTVEVYQDGASIVGDAVTNGTYATIYSDDGSTTIDQSDSANWITTDSRGYYEFYTEATEVVLAFKYNGTALDAIDNVKVSSDASALSGRVDKHDTVLGTAASATNLGTFTGTTISDSNNVVGALQELETSLEAVVSGGAGDLLSTNNLSDLTSASTARTNLGLGTVAIESTVPVAKGGTGVTTSTGTGSVVLSSAPTLTNPVVGTQSASDNSTKAASTAYVDNAVSGVGGGPTTSTLTSNTSVSSLTLVDVANLGFTPAASTRYKFKFFLLVKQSGGTSGGDIALSFPTGLNFVISRWAYDVQGLNGGFNNDDLTSATFDNSTNPAQVTFSFDTTDYTVFTIEGVLDAGGSVSGDLKIQSEADSGSNTIDFKAGSYVEYEAL